MNYERRKRRASAGGQAYANSIARLSPLREIVGHEDGYDLLECGHMKYQAHDIFGPYYPSKRRCTDCYHASLNKISPD